MLKNFVCIIIILLLTGVPAQWVAAETPSRWAILADSDIGDLLTIELSKRKGIQLVERVEIDKVLKEQALAAIATKPTVRIELGQILSADRLLFIESIEQQYRIRVFDTICGALLFDAILEVTSIETASNNIGRLVDIVEDRYRNGIKAVVAVTHLVSKNFDRSHDTLQRDYAALTTAALLRYDGIAVVALDELEYICREVIISGENVDSRIVPLIIQGEYTVTNETVAMKVEIRDGETTRFSLDKESLTFAEASTLFSVEIPQAVLESLDGENSVVPLNVTQQKAELSKTADLLRATGADALALKYREAIFLLDSGDFDNTLRLLLLGNIELILENQWADELTPEWHRLLEQIRPSVRDRYYSLPYLEHIFRTKQCTALQGQQIMRVMLSWRSPTKVEGEDDPLGIRNDFDYLCRFFPLLCGLPHTPRPASSPAAWWRSAASGTSRFRIDTELRDFHSLFELLDFTAIWNSPNAERFFTRDFAKRLFECQILLPKKNLFHGYSYRYGLYFLRDLNSNVAFLRSVPWDTWKYFCDLWRSTKNEDYIFFADYLEIIWKYANQAKLESGEFDNEVIPKILSVNRRFWAPENVEFPWEFSEHHVDMLPIASDVLYLEKVVHKFEKYHEVVYWFDTNRDLRGVREFKLVEKTEIERFRSTGQSLAARLGDGPGIDYSASRFPLKTSFTVQQVNNWQFPLDDTEGGTLLTPYDWLNKNSTNYLTQYRRLTYVHGGIPASMMFLEKLDEKTDIVWDHRRIMRIDAVPNGEPHYERIYPNPAPQKDQESILSVSCDARNIWIATANGVLVLAPSGKILTQFTESDQLPAFHKPNFMVDVGVLSRSSFARQQYLALFATAPGECIAIGRSPSALRTWVAKLTFEPDTGKKDVRLLLGTTREFTPEQQNNPEYVHSAQQIDVAFTCPWFSRFADSKNPQRRQLLLGRVFGDKGFDIFDPRRSTPFAGVPLLIDLNENKIMLLTERYPDLQDMLGGVGILQVGDSFVFHQGEAIQLFRRDESGVYQNTVLTDEKTPDDSWGIMSSFKQDARFIADDNKVYSPGAKWYCFDLSDPANPKTEVVATATYPKSQKLRHYSESAVFGIWAQYTEGAPWSIDLRTPTDTAIDLFKDYVPPDQYAKHVAAMNRIEQLGGKVYRGSTKNRLFLVEGKLQDGTVLHLDENWTGTAQDAELFKDLYRLSAVYFVNVQVGDEEFRQLYSTSTISDMWLVRTKISEDAVLKFPLQQLTRLTLENEEDKPIFTDRILESLAEKGTIKVLFFAGPGFTNKSYEILKRIPARLHAQVYYGSITEDVFNKINRDFE